MYSKLRKTLFSVARKAQNIHGALRCFQEFGELFWEKNSEKMLEEGYLISF